MQGTKGLLVIRLTASILNPTTCHCLDEFRIKLVNQILIQTPTSWSNVNRTWYVVSFTAPVGFKALNAGAILLS